MLERAHLREQIEKSFKVTPIVAILGPRQCGKTTAAKMIANSGQTHYFDLDSAVSLSRLEDPEYALGSLTGLVTIDEIQKRPDLFSSLRYLVDHKPNQQYLILGSASRDLIQQSAESLAGRITYLELTPFLLSETHQLDRTWLRGGFPRSFLAETDEYSDLWRQSYIRTYLEQDLPNLGIRVPAQQLQRFWMMLAHNHANILNASNLGRSLGVSHSTIRHYIDILSGTFMVRELKPWHENISKRQVKSPKIYFRDSGILHSLLGIKTQHALNTHPMLGASWEGFALEQVIHSLGARNEDCYFWATHADAELDLLIMKDGKRYGFEFKMTSAPKVTRSMKTAINDLKLDQLTIVTPSSEKFSLSPMIDVMRLEEFVLNR
ncbi:MAG: hypothetical protein COV52_01210 [Gammaproteobacteria bacterium CG11_big_fil_rev_8_21_14_0_20_46_22]|nr:MAG: hypothetical protein COW05_02390 [Gammaproteobacteria bacterium CG12_big_fil_rev_8_21_14_0_65_46_12]PIR11947.1 MAG: hypothetical protein COV52_01210 [Gammaproteobacteria bacterium CG11_big_fil_rev_8_21_14_0_20_46_22]